jgi:4-hydroxy-3-polyprenylbenzoate decarboxylase
VRRPRDRRRRPSDRPPTPEPGLRLPGDFVPKRTWARSVNAHIAAPDAPQVEASLGRPNLPDEAPFVIGISGGSGAPIAQSVLRGLADARASFVVVLSRGGEAVVREELGLSPEEFLRGAPAVYPDSDLAAPIASGSRRTRGMAIVPCSTSTVAKIAVGLGDTLISRAAHVHLKERRRLIVVPRETPVSAVDLRNMATLAELGAVVLPASPPFYLKPRQVSDLVDYLAGKVLDHLGVRHRLYRGWKEGEA